MGVLNYRKVKKDKYEAENEELIQRFLRKIFRFK